MIHTKGPSRNDVILNERGEGVDQKMMKGDEGQGRPGTSIERQRGVCGVIMTIHHSLKKLVM